MQARTKSGNNIQQSRDVLSEKSTSYDFNQRTLKALICVTRCHSLYQTTVYETRTNSSPGLATNNGMMSAFESSSNVIPYYLQGHLAAGIEHTTVLDIVQNIRVISWPYDLSYTAARLNNQCKSTPNFLELEGQVPEMIKYPNKQNKPNLLPGIITRKALMSDFESSPNKNPHYLQGHSAANITPTTVLETNRNVDGFSMPYDLPYPEAGSKVVCESPPNILGLEGQVPEVIEHHNISPSGLSSKENKSNSLPGIVTNDELMSAFESSPSKNPYYLQETSAAGIAPTKPHDTNPNAERFSIPGSSYPEARSNVVCESTPNIFGLEDLVPEVIKYPNILPSRLSSKQNKSNSLPGIITNKELMPVFNSLASMNPYYLQGSSATGIAPTTPRETNPNADEFSIPYGSSYPEAGPNVVCESTPNILGLEGLVTEVIKHPNIFPLGFSSKQNKPNLSPNIITRKPLMPDFEFSPNENPYYLQGPSAANITPTPVLETNPNIDGFSTPYGLLYPEAGSKDVCESPSNILGLEGQVPEVNNDHKIFPSGLSSKQYKSNSLPGIVTNNEFMPAFESSPSKNPYYLRGPSAAGIAPTKPRETNPNADRFSIPGSSYPEARSKVVCESTPNPSGLSSKQNKSNSLPGIITNKELMPVFESLPSMNPYYLQGPSATGIAPTTPRETNPNADGFSIPYGLSYPEAGSNVVCESTPNILGLEGLVPKVIKHPNIFPFGFSSKQNKPNLSPGIITRKPLMLDLEFSPNENPYYLQGPSAANITPTPVLETNPYVDGFSTPYGLLYPEAGSKDVCESPSNILGLEGQVPEVNNDHNIFPSGLSSKQYKSNSLPGIVTNDNLMPAFESSPSKNPYYLQGPSAAGIAPTKPRETNPNADRVSIPGSSYLEARSNVVCESTPNPSGLSSKQHKSNSLPGKVTNDELMPAFESSPSQNPYYLQGLSAAGIAPTKPRETNPNANRFSNPGSSYPEARSNFVCESTPNIFGLEDAVPEVIKYHNIFPSGLSSKEYKSNSLPGIARNDKLMPAFESLPSKNPNYIQGPSAAGIAPTKPRETNPYADRVSITGSSYPKARLNVVCKSTPNIFGLEDAVPEVIKYPNIFPSGLSSKEYKSNSLPGIVRNDELMPAFESSPSKNPYYLRGPSAAGIAPTKPRETNPNADRFSIPGSSYPEARSKVLCESTPNPSGLSSKQNKSNSLPGIITNKELMPVFESLPSMNPYYLQGPSATGIAPTTPRETNPNADGFSIPYGLSYPEAGSNVVCESTPNILGLEGLVPKVIKHPNIFPFGFSSKQNKPNLSPGIITRKLLMLDFEFSPNENPYYLQGPSAANITPTPVLETNPYVDGFSTPYGLLYPDAGSKDVCESPSNILGLEGQVPEVNNDHNIFPSGLSSKQYKSNSLPGIVTNDNLMPAFESSPSKNPYYLQGPSAAGIAPTKPRETNPNADRFSIPGSSYPEARSNFVCESTPNIFGLEDAVPEVIKYPNIFPSGLYSKEYKSNSLPGIVRNDELMPAFESSPSNNPYYLQGPSAAGIAPTKPRETNPNADRVSIPGSSYLEARSNVVCESTPNPSGLSSKQHKSNSLPGKVTNDELMPAFESLPSQNPYYLQGLSAAGIAPTKSRETNPNANRFSNPGSSYPEARSNFVCESTPNIFGLEDAVPKVIKYHNIFSSGLSSKEYKSNSLQGIVRNDELMPAFESLPSQNPYYLQGLSAAGIAPTKSRETNPNANRFSNPGSSYPKARLNFVCKSTPNIFGLEDAVPEVIKYPNIFPLGLSSKEYKSNSLPGIVRNDELMPAFESSPSKNPYYLRGPSAAGIAPTKPRETNPNADRFSIPGSSYPEARSNVVCESTPNPSGLSSKQHKSNSLPGKVTNDELMPAFESSPSQNPYYLQGPSAAGIAPTKPRETNPNADRFSNPCSSFPEARSNFVCESTPNIFGLEDAVPEVIKYLNIFPSGLSSKEYKSNSLPGIVTNDELMPAFESSPSQNPYYLQGPLAAGIAPTKPRETNPNADRFSNPGSSYPEARSNFVCESTPNIFGLEDAVPEVIKYPNIFPSGLSSKEYKSNSLPGIVRNDELMPAFESSPRKNPYYMQGPSAAGIAPTKPRETNPYADRVSITGSSYPKARLNVVCKSTPNIFGLEDAVPEVIKYPNILPSGLSSERRMSNSLPGIVTNDELMPAFESSPSKNPYCLQGPSAADIAPTTPSETNPNADGFSIFHSSHPEAGTNVVCESMPNILGLEGLVPEVIKHPNIFSFGFSSKQKKPNLLPGIIARKPLMPDFEFSPNETSYYLQGPSAANITPTTVLEANPNVDEFSMPYVSSYPKAGSNIVCESTPNIFGLEGLVPEVVKHPNILTSGLSFKQKNSNLLPGIITRKALMPAFKASPNKNPHYLQGISAANITPTTVLEANPNIDGFSMPNGLFYPEAGSNVVCESSPNILGLKVLLPEVIKHPNIFPSGLSSKQFKSNSLPGIVTNDELMPAFESSPTKNQYYLQGPSAASVAPITVCESNPNIDGFSWPYFLCYPETLNTVVCESTPYGS